MNAYVGGGALPKAVRGTRKAGMANHRHLRHCSCARRRGSDRAATAGLPPIDALNMWPYWSGDAPSSPRDTVHHDLVLSRWVTSRSSLATSLVIAGQDHGIRTARLIRNATQQSRAAQQAACTMSQFPLGIDLADDPAYAGDKHLLAALASQPDTIHAKAWQLVQGGVRQALSKHKGYWGHLCLESCVIVIVRSGMSDVPCGSTTLAAMMDLCYCCRRSEWRC